MIGTWADVLNRANRGISDALFVCSQLPLRLFGWRGLALEGTTHIVDMHPDDRMHVNAQPTRYEWKRYGRVRVDARRATLAVGGRFLNQRTMECF